MIETPSRRKKLASEPDFQRPPLWIHEMVAGILAPKREMKRRALLAMLNRMPATAAARPARKKR
jgi:hypothetical protein